MFITVFTSSLIFAWNLSLIFINFILYTSMDMSFSKYFSSSCSFGKNTFFLNLSLIFINGEIFFVCTKVNLKADFSAKAFYPINYFHLIFQWFEFYIKFCNNVCKDFEFEKLWMYRTKNVNSLENKLQVMK